jgi:hypothetical protein
MEPGVQTPEETLASGRGRAAIQLAAGAGAAPSRLRRALRVGLPDPAEARPQGARRPLGHRGRFHRPARLGEVYLPGAGWIGLDPTSGLLTGESHIPLAATPHYRNAAPISGMASSGRGRLRLRHEGDARGRASAHHQALLRRSWEALDALGHKVDAALAAGDVRLTMGGEPTFVSSTISKPPNGTPPPSARPSARWPTG